MKTISTIQKSLAVSVLVLLFTGCNQQEFYEKEFLEGVGVPEDIVEIPDIPKIADNTDGGSTSSGSTSGGSTTGGSTTGGSTSGGSTTGGSTTGGSTTGGSTTGGSTTGGSTTGGSTTGGSTTGGSTTGGSTTGGSTTGGSTTGGSTTGGSTTGGSTTGGSTTGGSTTGGSTSGGSTTGGSTTGGSTTGGSTTGGSTTGGSTTGGSTTGGSTTGGSTPGLCGDGTVANANDTFTQNTAQEGKVDILWVMDDSGSMGDEQDDLAFNFNAFINDFITRDVDFKMAITTTDGRDGRSGNMVGNPDLLTRAAAQANQGKFINDFQNMIRVGTRGSGREMGLETSKDFLERYRSWMRDDAFLIVVYISDEEDQSPQNVANYVNALKGLKASAGMVKAYSIVTQVLDPAKQWETLGMRYEEVSNETGGEVADIHQDFYTTLTNFGFKILELLDSFPLSGVPINAEIRITINDVEVSSGWTYDANSRLIRFDRNAIPSEGSIVIAYYQKCVGP